MYFTMVLFCGSYTVGINPSEMTYLGPTFLSFVEGLIVLLRG